MSFRYNLEGSLLAPDRSYQPRYINVIADVSRIRISNSPSANAETPSSRLHATRAQRLAFHAEKYIVPFPLFPPTSFSAFSFPSVSILLGRTDKEMEGKTKVVLQRVSRNTDYRIFKYNFLQNFHKWKFTKLVSLSYATELIIIVL